MSIVILDLFPLHRVACHLECSHVIISSILQHSCASNYFLMSTGTLVHLNARTQYLHLTMLITYERKCTRHGFTYMCSPNLNFHASLYASLSFIYITYNMYTHTYRICTLTHRVLYSYSYTPSHIYIHILYTHISIFHEYHAYCT